MAHQARRRSVVARRVIGRPIDSYAEGVIEKARSSRAKERAELRRGAEQSREHPVNEAELRCSTGQRSQTAAEARGRL